MNILNIDYNKEPLCFKGEMVEKILPLELRNLSLLYLPLWQHLIHQHS